MKMQIAFIGAMIFLSATGETNPSSLQTSDAYRQYVKRPKNELSKLIYLMDFFKAQDIKVNYDGYDYDAEYAARIAKGYIAKNFTSGDKAEKWLKIHAYRSQPRGNVIYLKYSDGKLKSMREILIQELKKLEETA
ncbi:MAG: hypothetical protein HYZ85_05670 [Candidatus Omnitrophica bacterium]|nr:hypothetical protein [Candidatus Omnitrophota bacterium]